LKSNKDLEITEFTVTGYASPEGNFESNRTLSDRRANSFADYLSSTHGVARDRFRVTGLGEDWSGLKEAVEKSSLTDKNEIIRVINSVSNPDARDAELKKLSGGKLTARCWTPITRHCAGRTTPSPTPFAPSAWRRQRGSSRPTPGY